MTLQSLPVMSDEELWRLSCDGDREAFGQIVKRYQTLVCSLAYSACGALGTSEDMAQSLRDFGRATLNPFGAPID